MNMPELFHRKDPTNSLDAIFRFPRIWLLFKAVIVYISIYVIRVQAVIFQFSKHSVIYSQCPKPTLINKECFHIILLYFTNIIHYLNFY